MDGFEWKSLATYWPMIVNVGFALLTLMAGWIAAKWANRLVIKAFRVKKIDEALGRFLASLAKYAVIAATVISALGRLGVEAASLITIFATAGLAIGLALQGSLSNFASGVMILLFRPFDIEDRVEIAGATGIVKDIGIMVTTLSTPENHRIIVPNGSILSHNIINFTTSGKMRGAVDVGVAYGSDIAAVKEVLLKAAKSVENVLQDPEPGVAFVNLGASSLDMRVLVWTEPSVLVATLGNVRQAVYDHLNEAGIEIPFTQVVVHQAAEAA